MRIDGREIAKKIFVELKKQTEILKEKNIIPHLAIILVGDDPASISYINQKELKAENIGIKTTVYNLESKIQNSELLKLINRLNADKNVHGIIVQRPLPKQINAGEISLAVDPKKDVDGFSPDSKFQMPIVMAVLKILQEIGINQTDLKSKKIVVIGKGETAGQPIITALQRIEIKPEIVISSTMNPELITKNADIIISAVGKPNILKPDMMKRGVILIGIGISRGESANLMGDYDQNEVENVTSFYTPTPGGVGPVNVAMLLKNLLHSAENSTE